MENLNHLEIPNHDNPNGDVPVHGQNTTPVASPSQSVQAVFENIEDFLIEKIRKHRDGMIFGCVAWLTSKRILEELSYCKNVQIVVQKEDFLRPESPREQKQNYWKADLQRRYRNVRFCFDRWNLKEPIKNLSMCSEQTVPGIRCMGNHNSDKSPAFPRMHNKFLVFCDYEEPELDDKDEFLLYAAEEIDYWPVAVWTGSYNMSINAGNSLENGIYIEDREDKENLILNSYLMMHHKIFALSEDLDWSSKWCNPDFRIGS